VLGVLRGAEDEEGKAPEVGGADDPSVWYGNWKLLDPEV